MKIGFCCKWIDTVEQIDGFKPKDAAKQLNTRVTTITWLNRQTREVAEQRLWDLMVHNIESIRLLVERVGNLDAHLRMVRLGSDILPAYTEPTWSYFGVAMTLGIIASAIFLLWASLLVGGTFALIFILVSSVYWLAQILVLLIAR